MPSNDLKKKEQIHFSMHEDASGMSGRTGPQKTQRRSHAFLRNTVLFLLGIVLLGRLSILALPDIGPALYWFEGKEKKTANIPFFVPAESSLLHIETTITLRMLHPHFFVVGPDDCMQSIIINDKPVPDAIAKFCDYPNAHRLNLAPYLREGTSTVALTVLDKGGGAGVDFRVSRLDPLHLTLIILMAALTIWYGTVLVRRFSPQPLMWKLYWILVGGSLLRMIYTIITPPTVRAHDYGGHIEYIRYILSHFRLPPGNGYELHQTPLYYFFAGTWWKALEAIFKTSEATILWTLQQWSLLFSIITLAACIWIARILFPRKNDHASALGFVAMIAVLPGLILFAPRINNDVLAAPLAFLAFAALLSWWKGGNNARWYLFSVFVGFAILTKTSAILLLPCAFIPLLLRRSLPLRKKIMMGGLSLLIIFCIGGWVPAYRLVSEGRARMFPFGNFDNSTGLRVTNTVPHFLIFNPIQIVRVPYNNTWTDSSRRQYFPEFLFRSAFSGEYEFSSPLKEISRVLLSCAIVLLAVALFGLWKSLRFRFMETLPLLLSLLFLLLGLASVRLRQAYACNQDFRYIPLLCVPLSYFIMHGATALPRLLRRSVIIFIIGYLVSSVTFILLLPQYA
ncbi:MAG: glycosyltransferase family 39 protein [Candidatus Peregrinibacteria bacterium]